MALKTINDLTPLTTPASTDLVGVWAVGAARMRKSTIAQTFSPMLAVTNVFSAKQTMDALVALKKNVAPGTTSGYLELGTDSNGDLKVQNDAGAARTLAGSISGGGTVATAGYTLTVPSTGTAVVNGAAANVGIGAAANSRLSADNTVGNADAYSEGFSVGRAGFPNQRAIFNYYGGTLRITARDTDNNVGSIKLATWNGSTVATRLSITSGGNVGINIETATAALQVVGLDVHANNAAAIAAGKSAGAFYRNSSDPSVVCVVY